MVLEPGEAGARVSNHSDVRVVPFVAAAAVGDVRKMMGRRHDSPCDEFFEKLRVRVLTELFQIDLRHDVLAFEHRIDVECAARGQRVLLGAVTAHGARRTDRDAAHIAETCDENVGHAEAEVFVAAASERAERENGYGANARMRVRCAPPRKPAEENEHGNSCDDDRCDCEFRF